VEEEAGDVFEPEGAARFDEPERECE